MAEKTKNLCKWGKGAYEEKLDKLRALVREPTHVCRKCGRAANSKKVLCKPEPIKG